MAHIDLGIDEHERPGIFGLLAFRPETAKPLGELADALLVHENSLTRGERELIAAYVSGLNSCEFCAGAHSALAAAQLDAGMPLVDQVHADLDHAPVSAKLRALLKIAGTVRDDARKVSTEQVAAARAEGATDREIHDTVLIAAAFCMFNRYVDGLGTIPAEGPASYAAGAGRIVTAGYSG